MPQDAICGAIWESLNKRSLIEITLEQKQEYYNDALKEITEEQLKSSDLNAVRILRRHIEEGKVASTLQTEAKNRAKKNHLMDWWSAVETLKTA